MSSQDQLVSMIIEIPTHMKGGTKVVTTSCVLSSLPTKPIEAPYIVISVKVVDLQIPLTPKPVPLSIRHIGVSVEVIMIDTTLCASKVFRTPEVVLRDTYY